MKYRNKKTGVVIKTFGKVSGGDWEPVQEPENVGFSETQKEDEAPEEETPAEEAPAGKSKTSRKGKK